MTFTETSAPCSTRLVPACLLALCVLAPSLLMADIYKWTDGQGKINYTQMPPPSGYTAEIIKEPAPLPEPPRAATSPASKVQARLEEEQKDRQIDAAKAEREKENAEIRRLNCDAATRNLAALEQDGQRNFIKANGEYIRPSDEERKQMIENTRAQVKEFCDE